MAKRIVVTGATGLIGSALTAALTGRGDTVVALSRDAGGAREKLASAGPADRIETVTWAQPESSAPPIDALTGADGVVHLLGETIQQRWTSEAKDRIRDSRWLPTSFLVGALKEIDTAQRPKVLVSQSATGYYGPRGAGELSEDAEAGDDFLAQVVVGWERAAAEADSIMRVVRTRTGVVLASGGGALGVMLPFFKLGIGGPVGGGKQYVPWIHLDDVVAGLIDALDNESLSGAVNLTAPNPVTNADFSHALGRALHRPAFLPVPSFALKLLYGEMSEIVLTGQRAVPVALQAANFTFKQPNIGPALEALLR